MNDLGELIKAYITESETNEHPFLLFDLANVHENDHTKVLMSLLNYNKNQFLPSFLKMIGAPDYTSVKVKPTDQKKAIGNNGTGFIDLYFEYKNCDVIEKVIVENKIYGAGDTEKQLGRYIATAKGIEKDDFEKLWKKWQDGPEDLFTSDCEDFKHIHVIYLTFDGSKTPEEESLPMVFRSNKDNDFEGKWINYYPINYLENIIPWLENDVLPNIPYSDDGIAIAGVRQYIASLKNMFSGKGNSKAISQYIEEHTKSCSDKDKYDVIIKVMNYVKQIANKKTEKDLGVEDWNDLPLQVLIRDLRAAAMGIFTNDGEELGGDWKLYFTPSFVFLYRQRWADLDTRKYSIPSIYMMIFTDKLLNCKKPLKWRIQIDHLDQSKKDNMPFLYSNHDKTAYYEIDVETELNDVNDPKSRKDYFKSLINTDGKLKEYIALMDNAVENAWNKKQEDKNFHFQESVLDELSEKINK